MDGKLYEEMDQNLSFRLNVSQFRRQKILDSIMSKDDGTKKMGIKIRQGFEEWLRNDKREKMFARGENPDDYNLDDITGGDEGVNTRNGFAPYKRIMNHNKNLLAKPKSVTIQKLAELGK